MRPFVQFLVLSVPTLASAAPLMSFDGACPGPVDISIIQVTPGGDYAIVSANGPGNATVSSGACAGTPLGLGAGLKLRLLGTADGAGRASHSPAIPIAACGAHVVTVDLDACEVSNVATFVPTANAECGTYGHRPLNQSWRHVDFNDGNGGVENCDIGAAGVPTWYRFLGAGGTLMPETAQVEYDCGTDAPGSISGRHPLAVGSTTTARVCYRWNNIDCNWTHSIDITNCGPFMVYDLIDPPASCLAYCTE